MVDFAKKKVDLETRLAVILERKDEIETEFESHHSRDWEDLAAERVGDEVLEGMGLSGQAEQRRILAALGQIVDGSYRICTNCGAPIQVARLDVVPETPLCRHCAMT